MNRRTWLGSIAGIFAAKKAVPRVDERIKWTYNGAPLRRGATTIILNEHQPKNVVDVIDMNQWEQAYAEKARKAMGYLPIEVSGRTYRIPVYDK